MGHDNHLFLWFEVSSRTFEGISDETRFVGFVTLNSNVAFGLVPFCSTRVWVSCANYKKESPVFGMFGT